MTASITFSPDPPQAGQPCTICLTHATLPASGTVMTLRTYTGILRASAGDANATSLTPTVNRCLTCLRM